MGSTSASSSGARPGSPTSRSRCSRSPMPHQVPLTVVAPVRPDAGPALEAALGSASVPFERLAGVHFARVFTLIADVAADGSPTSQKLVLMSDVDAPLDRH